MGTLNDRQFQSYRKSRPGRVVVDKTPHREEFAQAVVDADGAPLADPLTDLLSQMLAEQRRTNLLLQILTGEEVPAE